MSNKKHLPWFCFGTVVFGALLAAGWLVGAVHSPIADEQFHAEQITMFMQGNFRIFEWLTMLPVYHGFVAILMKIFQQDLVLNPMRIFNLLLSLPVMPAFIALYRHYHGHSVTHGISRTAQFVFMPILFVMFVVVYTDLLSLGCVLWMIERALKKHYVLSALLALLAISVRQTNILWVAYCCGLIFFQIEKQGFNRAKIIRFLKKLFPYYPVFLAFLIFVILNKGIAIGDASQHGISVNFAAVHFFLLTAFFVFLLRNIAALSDIFTLLRRYPWIILILIGYYFLYDFTYYRSHKYNFVEPQYFLRNAVLYYSTVFPRVKIVAFVPIAWMLLTLITEVWKSNLKREWFLLVLFGLLSFLPLPLIDQRYYLVAITFVLILARQRPIWVEVAFGVQSAAMAFWVVSRTSQGGFFL